MFKQMAEILHKAQNELEIGLDKLDEKQIKNTYNDLVALQIDIHREYTSHYARYFDHVLEITKEGHNAADALSDS
jgi:hypothetical protein